MPNRAVVARPRDAQFPGVPDINYVREQLKAEIEAGRIVVSERLRGSALTGVVNTIVLFYLDLIGRIAAPSDPRLLELILMAQQETNLLETDHVNAPPDAVRTPSIIAGRFLIERFAGEPTTGGAEPTPEEYRLLLAAAVELLQLGMFSDAIHGGAVGGEVWVDDDGYFCSALDPASQQLHQRFVMRVSRSSSQVRDQVRGEPAVPDDAIEAEFGVTWPEMFELSSALRDFPDEQIGVYVAERAWFIATLAEATGITIGRVEQWVDALSLEPRQRYLEPQPPYDMNDVMPWRYNRRLSYYRRPLVAIDGPGGREIAWSREHFTVATTHLVVHLLRGVFRGVAAVLEEWSSGVRSRNGERFNDQVADMIERSLESVIVRRRIDTFDGVRMSRANGDDIGDVDVLVADPGERLLVLTETKDFRVSLVPSTYRDELDDLEEALEHVRERVAWVRDHLPQVAAELGLEPAEIHDWRVHPRIVTDDPLATADARDWGIQMISFDELLALVNEGVIA